MTEQPSSSDEYGHLTGRKRLVIFLMGALTGLAVAAMFAWFAGRSPTVLELIVGIVLGGVLGLSASLGERRRRHTKAD